MDKQCECHQCIEDFNLTGEELFGSILPLSICKMIVCSSCGNKRCPHASNHRYTCTNSNDTGQEGSVYK